jgi:hypothetical protein
MFGADISEFTATRREFQELGSYTKTYPGTRSHRLFWEEQMRRSINGYHTGRDYIPGYFYFYLNFCPIQKVVYDKSQNFVLGQNMKGERVTEFADFWDSDYIYFNYLDEAEKLGQHAAVLKARGRGYSFKGASMLNRNYFLIKGSKNYVYAESEQFLTKDGILTKAWDIMSFIDENTAWTKRRQYKDTDMHKRASFQVRKEGKVVEAGYKSEIIGVIVDDSKKVRGKRGKLILWEEGGEFKGLLKCWQVARPSMEQGKVTFGLMTVFGTGGSAQEAAEGLEELFYNPEGYNIKPVPNIWEEGMEETKTGLFVPAYLNMEGYIDQYGNSDVEGAKQELLTSREITKKNARNQASLTNKIAEDPFTPSEAFLRTNVNIFPTAELSAWEKTLINKPQYQGYATPGEFIYDEGRIKFKPTNDKPIHEYPIKHDADKEGTIVIYHAPYRKENVVPANLYYICHDPYAQDGEGNSLGAAYVLARANPYTNPDDCIVAAYVARPKSMDDYNRNLFMLAEYYNAKIGFENDRGDVIGYAKRFKKLEYLQEEFTLPDNKELQSNRNRKYGMHMTEQRKRTGEIYLRDWLLSERGVDINGNKSLNLHFIYDVGLIRELIKYRPDGNFDRLSAMLIGMFFDRELHHKRIVERKIEEEDNFFSRNYNGR